jgi:hypothetical protein
MQCGRTFGRGLALHEAYCHLSSWSEHIFQYITWFFLFAVMIGFLLAPFQSMGSILMTIVNTGSYVAGISSSAFSNLFAN